MEIIANALQTIPANQNVYFTDTITGGSMSISHRSNSGLVTLFGNTNQCRARFKITFGGNIAVPEGGTPGPISLALAIDGETVPSTTMIVTPTAAETFFNVFSAIFVDVPRNNSVTISVKNIGTTSLDVENANLIIERVA
jgi:hypothetical protein